jgi:transcriptional regulator with XRE-family HTH domain
MVTRIDPRRGRLFLKEWREARGLTLQQVADRLEVDRSTIQRHETNNRRLTTDHLTQLAAALDCEPQDLWRDPTQVSQEDIARGLLELSPAQRRQALEIISVLKRTGTNG